MPQPEHTFEATADPHEDWYFALLPPDWKRLTARQRQECIAAMDPVAGAECRRRLRMRKAVAAGMALAQKETEAEAAMWLGAALDEALDRIANRAHPYFLQFGDDDEPPYARDDDRDPARGGGGHRGRRPGAEAAGPHDDAGDAPRVEGG